MKAYLNLFDLKEAVAQGTANILSGLFSGMGGCAMIGQKIRLPSLK